MFLHLSAVLSCNFTNHLFTISQDILIEQGFDLNILKPLIVETINKSLEIGPDNAQTGPAFRGDLTVLEQHMKELKNNKAISKIYQSITQHILDTYHGWILFFLPNAFLLPKSFTDFCAKIV